MIANAAKRRHPERFRACIFALVVFICLGLMCRADERKVQKRVAPVYPELARRMHVSGAVRILATVAPDGTVTDVKTLNGNKLLSPAAEEAVKKWKFVPGDSESTVPIEVNFDVSN